jgi:hypothetical protein
MRLYRPEVGENRTVVVVGNTLVESLDAGGKPRHDKESVSLMRASRTGASGLPPHWPLPILSLTQRRGGSTPSVAADHRSSSSSLDQKSLMQAFL